jgi:hypothetical protein
MASAKLGILAAPAAAPARKVRRDSLFMLKFHSKLI